MTLALQILLANVLLAFLTAIAWYGWRTSKVTLHGAQEDMLRGFTRDWEKKL